MKRKYIILFDAFITYHFFHFSRREASLLAKKYIITINVAISIIQ